MSEENTPENAVKLLELPWQTQRFDPVWRSRLITIIAAFGGAVLCKTYPHAAPLAPLMTGYGNDLFRPVGCYLLATYFSPLARKHPVLTATTGFVLASGFEVMQKLGYYPGSFDPNDFIAYAAGGALALGIEFGVLRPLARARKQQSIDNAAQSMTEVDAT